MERSSAGIIIIAGFGLGGTVLALGLPFLIARVMERRLMLTDAAGARPRSC